MKQCKCPNCGAAINIARRICEYCGTTFKEELDGPLFNQEIRYVVARPGVKTYGAKYMISEAVLRDLRISGDARQFGDFMTHVHNELARKLADAIMKEIEISETTDIETMSRIYSARLRILDPSFRF